MKQCDPPCFEALRKAGRAGLDHYGFNRMIDPSKSMVCAASRAVKFGSRSHQPWRPQAIPLDPKRTTRRTSRLQILSQSIRDSQAGRFYGEILAQFCGARGQSALLGSRHGHPVTAQPSFHGHKAGKSCTQSNRASTSQFGTTI